MKLKFWGDDHPEQKPDANEADALRGKYSYEDLVFRKKQLMATEITGADTEQRNLDGTISTTPAKEDWIDTMRRARTSIDNGQGALGQDFPHGRRSAIADFQLGKLTRWAHDTLSETNTLRRFLEADEKDNFHLTVSRSIERDLPEVVFGYKPMLNPTGEGMLRQPEITDRDKKKP